MKRSHLILIFAFVLICSMCILLRRSVNYIQITANDIPTYPQSQDVVRIPLEPYDIAEMRRIGEDGQPLSLQTVLEFRSSDSLSAISAFYQTYWQQHGFTCNTTPPQPVVKFNKVLILNIMVKNSRFLATFPQLRSRYTVLCRLSKLSIT